MKRCIFVADTRKRVNTVGGSEDMSDNMTNDQYNANLEILACLIEAAAATPEDAARIVRAAKTK